MRKALQLVCILSLLLFSQCDKENPEPTLPPETTRGANTFGAIVNGEIWSIDLNDSDFSGGASLPLNDLLTASGGFSNKDRDESIGFFILETVTEGKIYYFNDNNNNNIQFTYLNSRPRCIYRKSNNDNTTYSGSIEITNLTRKTISGRFEFEIFLDGEPRTGTNNCGVITVKSGRFDIKYIN